MHIALIYPPTCDPTAPYAAIPTLTGFLRHHGVRVLPVDANVEAWDSLLRPEPLTALAQRVQRRIDKLEQRQALDHSAQLLYHTLWDARGAAQAAPAGIAEARRVLKDPVAFFDAERYERAVQTIDAACTLISAAYAPLSLSFTGYRTPFALTTPEEIAHDAAPEQDPFHGYLTEVLVPRLRAAGVDAIGISLCFPGQVQPAFSFALKLKALLPEVHLTCGGPALTQLLIKHRGQDLRRALGPFDSAVVFEGEHTLLRLCQALDEAKASGADPLTLLREIPNVVHRDPLLGARYLPGHSAEDLKTLPAPDFDGLPLELYFSPFLTLPYDPTRGCYWGKCTFCHYGLAEVGTASYRERPVETAIAHLEALAEKYKTNYFYLSQDSVAPKTLLKLAQGLAERQSPLRWATDLKAENYLNEERALALKAGGAVACAIGVETAAPRVLSLIDKGAPVSTVRKVIGNLAAAGVAVEAMCFTDFPTETYQEALTTLRFLHDLRAEIALYIVGEFDLTEGALVAKEPERFGVAETWHVKGDLLKTGLFYEERRPPKRPEEEEQLDEALARLDQGHWLRRYPWAGSLSTAHTVFYYDRFGPGVFRDLAKRLRGRELRAYGARPQEATARYDLALAALAQEHEGGLWHHLVRERREVSRALYRELAAQLPPLRPSPARYRLLVGEAPERLAGPPGAAGGKRRGAGKSRRPSNAVNSAG